MINQGLKMLKRAIDERPKGGMQTGMPKIQLREADAVRAAAELEWAQQRIAELEQEVIESKRGRVEMITHHNLAVTRAIKAERERDNALNKFHVIADKHGEPDSYKCVVYDMEDPELKIKRKLISMGWVAPSDLNAVRREAFIRGYDEALNHFELVQDRNIQSVANQHYPDKEV